MLQAMFPCLKPRIKVNKQEFTKSRMSEQYMDNDAGQEKVNAAAVQFVDTMMAGSTSNPDDPQLHKDLEDIISTMSWSEYLAASILSVLERALRSGVKLGKTVAVATEKAEAAAVEFAKDHPVYYTIIALGVLVQIAPWVLAWLGFAELGIVEGSWAALWQARYAGYVPKGSLFSFLQRLGMIYRGVTTNGDKM